MGTSFEIVSPVDGQVYRTVEMLSLEKALAKLSLAEVAQAAFRRTPIIERTTLCRRFLEVMRERQADFAGEVTASMGKPISQARGEIGGLCERTEALCLAAPHALADQLLPEKPGLTRFIRREPLGIVMDIAAWNYPYVVAINVVAPAILAGNAVLLKHAPQTAVVAEQFEEAFRAAGAPEGLVQSLMVDHDTVNALLQTRRIHHVGFTGSVRGGAEVYSRVAAAGFASCGLEMGGKDAAIVLDDADFEKTVVNLVDGAFYNAGQSCCAVERIYVPEKMHDAFVAAFVAETHKLKLGDPRHPQTTLGPVVNAAAAVRIRGQVQQALSEGAKLATDDSLFQAPFETGCYLPPQVLTGVNHAMAVMSEETFGPVVGIMAYRDEAEAVRLANDSRYGLTGSVWSTSEERALAICDQLEVGTTYMNRCDAVDPDLPWVGIKDSGLGFTLSHWGIVSMTRPKSFNLRTK